jgi:hypothetical protein
MIPHGVSRDALTVMRRGNNARSDRFQVDEIGFEPRPDGRVTARRPPRVPPLRSQSRQSHPNFTVRLYSRQASPNVQDRRDSSSGAKMRDPR